MLEEIAAEESEREPSAPKKIFIIVVLMGLACLFLYFVVFGVFKALAIGRGFGAS